MVAKSYQSLEQVSDVYSVNGREYVKVRLKSGSVKQVRWYSEKEYAKMYPEEKENAAASSTDPYYRPQKNVLGFENGYITIFKGDTYSNLEWFQESPAKYTRWWGWYFGSTQEIPEDLPANVEPIRLDWSLVGNEEGRVLPEDQVKTAIESLLYEEGTSEWVGSIGERIEITVTITKAHEMDGYYGRSVLYTFNDCNNNIFIWFTSSNQNIKEGDLITLRGTIKEFQTYRNTKQTVLTRCSILA